MTNKPAEGIVPAQPKDIKHSEHFCDHYEHNKGIGK